MAVADQDHARLVGRIITGRDTGRVPSACAGIVNLLQPDVALGWISGIFPTYESAIASIACESRGNERGRDLGVENRDAVLCPLRIPGSIHPLGIDV